MQRWFADCEQARVLAKDDNFDSVLFVPRIRCLPWWRQQHVSGRKCWACMCSVRGWQSPVQSWVVLRSAFPYPSPLFPPFALVTVLADLWEYAVTVPTDCQSLAILLVTFGFGLILVAALLMLFLAASDDAIINKLKIFIAFIQVSFFVGPLSWRI